MDFDALLLVVVTHDRNHGRGEMAGSADKLTAMPPPRRRPFSTTTDEHERYLRTSF
jgi:hypothetical protein